MLLTLAGTVLGSVGWAFVVAEGKDPCIWRPAAVRHFIFTARMTRLGRCWRARCVSVWRKDVWRKRSLGRLCSCRVEPPHTYWNPEPGLARYLLVMTSNVYSPIEDVHALNERSPEALSAVFAQHDSELVKEWSAFTARDGRAREPRTLSGLAKTEMLRANVAC